MTSILIGAELETEKVREGRPDKDQLLSPCDRLRARIGHQEEPGGRARVRKNQLRHISFGRHRS